MVKSEKRKKSYTDGNVAYNIEPEKIEKVKKVPERKKKNSVKIKTKLKLMGSIIMVFLISFLLVCRFTTIINMSSDVRKIKSQVKNVSMENDNIKVELAAMNNLKNIENTAISKDGMVVPNPENVYYVKVKSLTVSSEKQETTAFQTIQKFLGLIY